MRKPSAIAIRTIFVVLIQHLAAPSEVLRPGYFIVEIEAIFLGSLNYVDTFEIRTESFPSGLRSIIWAWWMKNIASIAVAVVRFYVLGVIPRSGIIDRRFSIVIWSAHPGAKIRI
jgi:hypothetical protein